MFKVIVARISQKATLLILVMTNTAMNLKLTHKGFASDSLSLEKLSALIAMVTPKVSNLCLILSTKKVKVFAKTTIPTI